MSNSEDILKNLNLLKSKLEGLEVKYGEKMNSIDKRSKIHESLEKKLESLVSAQNDRIKVEAGGRIYETTKSNVLACIFPNLLKDQLEEIGDKNGFKTVYYVDNQPVESETNYFVDIDKKNFKLILKMLRSFYFSEYKEKFSIYLTDKIDENYLKQEIRYFFKGSDDIFSMINFIKGSNRNV